MTIVNGILFNVEIENKASRLVFPSTMQKIDKMAYESLNLLTSTLESIEVEEGNEYFHSKNNCLIETATKKLVLGCKNSIIPDDGSVEIIGAFAFNGCTGAKSITIPEVIKELGYMAFAGTDFEELIVPQSVELIGESCFTLNPRLRNITIKNKCTKISDIAFGTKTEKVEYFKVDFDKYNSDNLKICAPANSTAIAYAKKFGIKYEELVK